MNDALRDAYLRELADDVHHSISVLAEDLTASKPGRDLRWGDAFAAFERLRDLLDTAERRRDLLTVVSELLATQLHSQLVTLDGGTALSGDGRVVYLTDQGGQIVGEGLHEFLFDHLDVRTAIEEAAR